MKTIVFDYGTITPPNINSKGEIYTLFNGTFYVEGEPKTQ